MLIGEKYRVRLSAAMCKLGIYVYWFPDIPNVDFRVSGHIDLGAIHLGTNRILLSEEFMSGYDNLVNYFTKRGFRIFWSKNLLTAKFPGDCNLNACILGEKIIHRLAITESELMSHFSIDKRINVSQGYTKCSICVVNENSVITADENISAVLTKLGVNVLLITPGCITLEGYDTGFIGGATFKLSRNELAFTGQLNNHPDKARIESFLELNDVKPVYLTDDPIFDIGSAIPVIELYDDSVTV